MCPMSCAGVPCTDLCPRRRVVLGTTCLYLTRTVPEPCRSRQGCQAYTSQATRVKPHTQNYGGQTSIGFECEPIRSNHFIPSSAFFTCMDVFLDPLATLSKVFLFLSAAHARDTPTPHPPRQKGGCKASRVVLKELN